MQSDYEKHMRLLSSAVSSLQQRVKMTGPQNRTPQELSTDLSTALEELVVTEEELRRQNAELLETQGQLLEEQQRYRSLFEQSPVAYIITDARGAIRVANKAAGELLNVRLAFLEGKPLGLYVSPSDSATFRRLLHTAREAPPTDAILHIRPREREEFQAVVTLSGEVNEAGTVTAMRWLIRDARGLEKQVPGREELHRLRRMLCDQEFEEQQRRHELGRKIHDNLAQVLAVVRYRLQALAPGTDATELQQWVRETDRFVAEAAKLTRDLHYDLSPPMLRDGDLGIALQWLAEQVQQRYGLRARVALDADLHKLSQELCTLLFHTLCEFLLECARRGCTGELEVGLRNADQLVTVTISEPGAALSWAPAEFEGDGTLGRVRERVIGAGGSIEVHSDVASGTRVTIAAPHTPPPPPPRRSPRGALG